MALSRPLNAVQSPLPLAVDGTGQGFSRSYRRRFARESGPVMVADFVTGQLPTGWAFTRNTNATRIGPSGLVELAPHNWLNATSEDITGAGWAVSNAVGTTATRLAYVSPASAPQAFANTLAIGFTGALRFNARYVAGSPWLWVYFNGLTGGSCWMNVQTGAAGIQESGVSVSLVPDGLGGFDVTLLKVAAAGNSGVAFLVSSGDGATSPPAGSGAVELRRISFTGSAGHPYYATAGGSAYFGPRFDYDPSTLAARGLLLEQQSTNLCLWGGDMMNAAWPLIGTATRATPAGRAAPDGSQAVQFNFPSALDMVRQSIGPISPGVNYTVSLWVRKAAAGAATNVRVTTNNTTAWNTGASLSIALTNTWQRVSLTGQISSGNGMYLMIGRCDATSADDATCAGNVEVWGVQLEQLGYATSYIPTTSASATRAADTLGLVPLVIPGAAFSMVVEGALAGGSSNYPTFYCFGKGTQPTEEVTLYAQPGGLVTLEPKAAGTAVAQFTLGPLGAGQFFKAASRYALNNFAVSWNGGAVQTDTVGAFPAGLFQISFGSLAARGNPGTNDAVWLRRFAAYGSALPDAILRSLST